tara:strand:+ start:3484 stop:3864 length:381 start_codon:yes stop_codon:yes gene_type:complete
MLRFFFFALLVSTSTAAETYRCNLGYVADIKGSSQKYNGKTFLKIKASGLNEAEAYCRNNSSNFVKKVSKKGMILAETATVTRLSVEKLDSSKSCRKPFGTYFKFCSERSSDGVESLQSCLTRHGC